MSVSAGTSVRSVLAAGVAVAAAGAVAIAPSSVPQQRADMAPVAASPVVNLTSLGSDIKYLYNAAQPWAAYGAELATYAMGFVPGLWWVAPGIDLAYFSIEPLVQAAVYSFADAIDLNFAQIPIDINEGLTEAGQNFATYSLLWLNSLVPLPPLPPLPPAAAVPRRRGGSSQ